VTDTPSNRISTDETITTWLELAGLVETYRANAWIFRGVHDARYKLQPAIGRPGARKDIDTAGDLPFNEAEELSMLAHFQREVRPHVATPRRSHLSKDWDLQAVAQHHGLNTRLLDWSESPLIAAFFAVEPSGPDNDGKADAALYGIPCPHVIDSGTDRWLSDHDVVAI
jgi:hypothetical protein